MERDGGRSEARSPRVTVWRDVLAVGLAVLVAAALGALVILPQVYPKREVLGYLAGTAQSYEFRATKLRSGGFLDVTLDRGETIRLRASGDIVPGDRICVRATLRGSLIEGYLVAMDRCTGDGQRQSGAEPGRSAEP